MITHANACHTAHAHLHVENLVAEHHSWQTHLAWVSLAGTPHRHLIGTTGHTLGLSTSWLLLMSSIDSLQPKLPSQPLVLVSHPQRTWHSATPAFSRRPPPIFIRTWLDPLGHLSLTGIFMCSSTPIPVILWAVTFQSSIRGHSHGPRFLLPHFCSRKSQDHRKLTIPAWWMNVHIMAGPWGQQSVLSVLFVAVFLLPIMSSSSYAPTPTPSSHGFPSRFLRSFWHLERTYPSLSYCFMFIFPPDLHCLSLHSESRDFIFLCPAHFSSYLL